MHGVQRGMTSNLYHAHSVSIAPHRIGRAEQPDDRLNQHFSPVALTCPHFSISISTSDTKVVCAETLQLLRNARIPVNGY